MSTLLETLEQVLENVDDLNNEELTELICHLERMRVDRAVQIARESQASSTTALVKVFRNEFAVTDGEARNIHMAVLARKDQLFANMIDSYCWSTAMIAAVVNLARTVAFNEKTSKAGTVTKRQLKFAFNHLSGFANTKPQELLYRMSAKVKDENKFLAYQRLEAKKAQHEADLAAFTAANPDFAPAAYAPAEEQNTGTTPLPEQVESTQPVPAVETGTADENGIGENTVGDSALDNAEGNAPVEQQQEEEKHEHVGVARGVDTAAGECSCGCHYLVGDKELNTPGCIGSDADVRFKVTKTGPNSNELVLSGVRDIDAKIIQQAVSANVKNIPAEELSRDRKVNLGRAAIMGLRSHIRTHAPTAKIALNLVVDADQLKNDKETAITAQGVSLSGMEVLEAIEKWGCSEALLVVDAFGRAMSYTKGRLANSKIRTLLEVIQVKCAWPGCDCCVRLQAHHLIKFILGGETSLSNMVLMCEHHHGQISGKEERFRVFRDLGTSVWVTDSGDYYVGLMAAPHSTIMTRLGKQRGLDSLIPTQMIELKRQLINETWQRLRKEKRSA
ncbi:MAG: HNH endonuclease signature motif containing protein [Corynebacterium sp.]|nr:HNH endonuclease signature motif containing protein [Corynebacterium sp.]